MQQLIHGYAIVVSVVSAYVLLVAVINLASFLLIRSKPSVRSGGLVSVLIPARNEEAIIEECLSGLLDQSYKNYEVIVLDDNSTDNTLKILKRLEAQHERLRVLEAREKPERWKGKTYAVQQLAEAADGEYLYIVDADTKHDRDAVSWAVSQLQERNLDAFSGMPVQITRTFAEKLLVPIVYLPIVFVPLLIFNRRRPRRPAFGVGQFFVFRKECFFQLGGMHRVKSKITKDLAMSSLLKREGYRFQFLDTRGHVSCRMYGSFREVINGFTKNMYDLAGIAPAFTAIGAPVIPVLFTIPSIGLLAVVTAAVLVPGGAINWLLVAAVLTFFVAWGIHLIYQKQSFWSVFLAPVFFAVLSVLIYYGLGRYLRGRRPVWKSRKVARSGS